MSYVDFHIHSYYSDGTMSPKEILEEAIRKNISRVAITDHPTHSKKVEKVCLEICKAHNLIITSGSDCHGDFEETTIGQLETECTQVTL